MRRKNAEKPRSFATNMLPGVGYLRVKEDEAGAFCLNAFIGIMVAVYAADQGDFIVIAAGIAHRGTVQAVFNPEDIKVWFG